MAHQQVYQAYPQNKGTLIPGQTISVNNYTVQVERYLSQGGFAHVYLVRTPTPVYNTTHHVLKRIAVASESMLTEVKKEVDIMRLLKGHPNIVHLIDAAWHKLPNGTFEVFILMEYCPGGGIIDMMNRRLRERLTEAEILQIFVDVCEGLAYMHNSRPPLLHRDLKVENILQSSPTSFKLCDFGSATTVSNPPTNMQEIRALEADLNKHTTLQYRAPEMVDVYSKRPVNEKSDIWALGVLLYKLCYYTTPFEEHGPLAILNVQYRIPSYPVYSQDMNMLIGSMLREHGAQRPTVFELLNHVHRLRGTKSKFSYNVPVPPPLLARHPTHAKPQPAQNPLEDVISYKSPSSKPVISVYDSKVHPQTIPPASNQGVQAREKVLEAIAPMRRGRPSATHSSSRPASPQKLHPTREKTTDWMDSGFENEKDHLWKSVTEKSSSMGTDLNNIDDGWSLKASDKKSQGETKEQSRGFGDDFAEKLWSSPDPNTVTAPQPPKSSSRPNINSTKLNDAPLTPLAFTGTSTIRPKPERLIQNRDKDAFEGLGLMSSMPKAAPTLGEARKLRTGLASMTLSSAHENHYRDNGQLNTHSARPSPSPQPRYLSTTPLQAQSVSPVPTPGSGSSYKHPHYSPSVPSPSPSAGQDGPIESKYPSLEELDAQFSPTINALYPAVVNDSSSHYMPAMSRNAASNRAQHQAKPTSELSGSVNTLLRPSVPQAVNPHSVEGVRSEQVTGIAMRETKESRKSEGSQSKKNVSSQNIDEAGSSKFAIKPMVIRKHPSSVTMNPSFSTSKSAEKDTPHTPQAVNITPSENLVPPKFPARPHTNVQPRDWLTGDDFDDIKRVPTPVLRDSPSKRASFIEVDDFEIPQSSAITQYAIAPERIIDEPPSADISPTVSKFKRAFPAIDKIDTAPSQQPTASGLTDNWSPVARRGGKDADEDSSSADEGPEDVRGIPSLDRKRHASRTKGRQSSVHELVYQYGGPALVKEKESEKEANTAAIQRTREQESVKERESEREREKERERELEREREINRERQREKEIKEAEREKEIVREREKLKNLELEREKEKERDRERERPPMHYSVGDYKVYKPKAPGLAPPAAQDLDRKTPSPTSNTNNFSSTTMNRSPRLQTIPLNDKPLAPINGTKQTSSARSRPQSMFIFPSKSADSSSTPTTNLMPPQETRPRATRRTSISDMVQHYEAIGGSVKSPTSVPPTPPSPINRPVSTKATTMASGNGRMINNKVSTEFTKLKPVTSQFPVSIEASVRHTEEFSTKSEPPRHANTNTGLSRTPTTKTVRKTTLDNRRDNFVRPSSPETSSGNVSAKPDPPAASYSKLELSSSRPAKVSHPSESFKPSSPRKPPISINEDILSKQEEPISSPPEQPYQGVGRLIDQWQKKSAEAEQSRPVPGKFLSKRPGMLRGEDR